jgi:SPP1 gp7 family putative phage head morphogenesis protein
MSALSNFTDKFVIAPLAKRMTQIITKGNSLPADAPHPFAVPFGFNQQSLEGERRQLGSGVTVQTLRNMSVSHETTRAAINVRKRQINQLMWDVIDTDLEGGPSYSDQERLKIKRQFQQLGGPGIRFSEMMNKLIEDLLVLDAFCFYKQRTRGGQLLRIIPVDAGTIKIQVDESGMRPMPPDIAYEQWIRGTKVADMTTDELVYESMNPRTNSVFGLSPLETLMLTVDAALRATLYNINYLSDNNLPPGFLEMPPEWTTQQIKEYKEFFDAAMSGSKAQSRLFTIPSGAKYSTVSRPKDFQFKDFFEYLDRKVCMLFDVTPQELGMTGQQYKENADSQETIQMRKGLKPLAHFIEDIFTDIIQIDFGYPDLAFRFKGLESKYSNEDAKTFIPLGVISVDDVRIDRGEKPLGVPNFVMTGSGPIPVTQIGQPAPTTVSGGETVTQTQTQTTPADEESKPKGEIDAQKQITPLDELRAWQSKAVNDMRKKGKVFRKFIATQIPDDQQIWIRSELAKAETITDIKEIFKGKKIRRNKGLEALEKDKRFSQFRGSIKAGVLSAIEPFTKPETIDKLVPAEKVAKADNVSDFFDGINIEGFDDYLQWAAEQGGQQAYSNLGLKGSFTLTNDKFKDMLGDRENYLINSVDNTTKDWLVNQIKAGKDQGLTNDEIADAIADNAEEFSDSRAEMIVNTEVANALQQGELDTYVDQGIEKKRWVASDDDLVDPICQELDGEVASVDDEFSSGDDAPPAHPNCRCYIQAVLDRDLEEGDVDLDLRKEWVTIRGNPVFIEDGSEATGSSDSRIRAAEKQTSAAGKYGNKTLGQMQREHQSKDLTNYEDAFNSGDTGKLQALAEKNPSDARFHVHERSTPRGMIQATKEPLNYTLPTKFSPSLYAAVRGSQQKTKVDDPQLKKDWITMNGNHIFVPEGSGETIADENMSGVDRVVHGITQVMSREDQGLESKLKEDLKMPRSSRAQAIAELSHAQEGMTANVKLPDQGPHDVKAIYTDEKGEVRTVDREEGGVGDKNFNLDGLTEGMSQGKMNDFVNKQLDKEAPEANGAGKLFNWKVYNANVDQIQKGVAGDPNLVRKYMDDMKRGAKFPPIKVVQLDGKPEIISGMHRFEAAVNSGAKNLPVFYGTPK